jgi:hypothetical protein
VKVAISSPPVNVRSADRGACAEVLGNVLDTEVLMDVLLPGFVLPPRAGVCLLRPEEEGCVCDGSRSGWVGARFFARSSIRGCPMGNMTAGYLCVFITTVPTINLFVVSVRTNKRHHHRCW